MLILARLLHVVFGVFWGGAIFFTALLLVPAVQDAGPEGGKVMGALARRGMLTLMPVLGVVTILSGLWLYWIASAGFSPAYMRSRPGRIYGLGMVMAMMALGTGLVVMRPSIVKAATAEPAQAQALRARAATAGLWVAFFVAITVICMAVGRYV